MLPPWRVLAFPASKPADADLAGASFDMQMFVGCRGRERTLSEWTSLIRDGGMALEEVVRLRSLGSILVLRLG